MSMFPLGSLIQGASNARSAYSAGQKGAENESLSAALQLMQLKKQEQDDALKRALSQAQTGHYGALADSERARAETLRNPQEGLTYRTDANGNIVALPTKIQHGTEPAKPPTPPPTTEEPQSDIVGEQPGAPPQQASGAVSPPSMGIQTGVKAQPKQFAPKGPQADPLVKVVRGGKTIWVPRSQAVGQTAPEPVGPAADRTLVQTVGPDGQPVYTKRSDAAGLNAPVGGRGGGQSLAPEDRAKMYAQAQIDNAEMKRIEKRVLDGDLDFGTGAGLAAAAQGAHGSPLSEAASVLGNRAAGGMDPDIQTYITANSSYGRIMGNLQSKRYTDNQAQIEKTISGLKGNDLKKTILYKQTLRDASLADPVILPSKGGGRGGGNPDAKPGNRDLRSSTTTRAQQLWDAAVAKHGKEKVLAEVGPRPE